MVSTATTLYLTNPYKPTMWKKAWSDLKWIELKSHNKKRFWACRVLEVKFWTMWRGAYPCTPHSTKAEARACKVRDLPNLHIKTPAL